MPPLREDLERLDRFDRAVRTFGHIHIWAGWGGLMVEFDPRTASRLAVIAAFYELCDRAPDKIVLVCRGAVNQIEILGSISRACQRIEELIDEFLDVAAIASATRDGPTGAPPRNLDGLRRMRT